MYVPNSPRPTGLSRRGLLLLCPREWDALMCIADALSNEEIAEKLRVTPKSVENYRTRIGEKLQQNGVGKLSQFAEQHRAELRVWYEEVTGKLPPPIMGDIEQLILRFKSVFPSIFEGIFLRKRILIILF